MTEKRCSPHDYDGEGKCRNCDELTNDAFWALLGGPKGTVGLRLRPGKDPEFIPETQK